MPPPRPCWPAQFLMRLREVGYPPHQAGLAFWKDWRDSCLYSALIPSVPDRSALFVRNCRSHRRRQLMMLFQPELGWSVLGSLGRNWRYSWAGPLALDAGLLCKSKKQRGSAGARPLPLRCLSQFFLDERKDQLLRRRMFCVPFTDGVIAYAFSNWMVVRILSHWTKYFLPLSLSD